MVGVLAKAVCGYECLSKTLQQFISERRAIDSVVEISAGFLGHSMRELPSNFMGVICRRISIQHRRPLLSSIRIDDVLAIEFVEPWRELFCIVAAGKKGALLVREPEDTLRVMASEKNSCAVFQRKREDASSRIRSLQPIAEVIANEILRRHAGTRITYQRRISVLHAVCHFARVTVIPIVGDDAGMNGVPA